MTRAFRPISILARLLAPKPRDPEPEPPGHDDAEQVLKRRVKGSRS